MKPLLMALLCLAAFSAYAEKPQVTVDLARAADKIRSGEIELKYDLGMGFEQGRYHEIHGDIMLMGCTSCHIGEEYREGVLNFSKYKPWPEEAKGQLERSVCLGCHQEGGVATTFYTPSTENN